MSNDLKLKEDKMRDKLSGMIERNMEAIPQNVNSQRLLVNAMMYVNGEKNIRVLADNDPNKIAQIIFNFIVLGLDVFNKEAYIIPFGNTLTVIRDYKGEAKLAKMYSVEPIKNIVARVVYEDDEYFFNENDDFIHSFDPFKSTKDRKMIGAYCTISYKNGDRLTEFVNADEIQKVKDFSKSASSNSSPWQNWEESMWKKTVIRKALKLVPLDFGITERVEAYQKTDNDLELNVNRKNDDMIIEQKEPEFTDVIEGEVVSMDDL